MRKMVQYLYEYQNGRPVQNVGFVRGECKENSMSLQIYGRGFPIDENQMFEIFMVYFEDDSGIGISMGTIRSQSPVFGYRLEYDIHDVGGQDIFDKIRGIVISSEQAGDKRWYGAAWDGQNVNPEQMIRKEEYEQKLLKMTTLAGEEELIEPFDSEEAETEEPESEQEVEQVSEKDQIFKITREDLARLPRTEWKLANNHFLLHGYHNYHHLVSFEKDGACWIGVPGIYHPKEEKVAYSFGFDQFMKPDEGEIELAEEQMDEGENFGYWCRRVSSVIGE